MNWKDPAIAKILLLTFAAVLGYGATMFTPPEVRDGDLHSAACAMHPADFPAPNRWRAARPSGALHLSWQSASRCA